MQTPLIRLSALTLFATLLAGPTAAQGPTGASYEQPLVGELVMPFNPGMLDPETKIAHMVSIAEMLDWQQPFGMDFEIEIPVVVDEPTYERMLAARDPNGLESTQSENRIGYGGGVTHSTIWIGSFRCTGRAHNPHRSRDSGTVKAKGDGNCTYTPIIDWLTPPMVWSFKMALSRPVDQRIWHATHRTTDQNPVWEQNRGGWNGSGTQVDSNQCVNGTYNLVIDIDLFVPWPWFVEITQPLVAYRVAVGVVTTCPS